MFVCLAGWLSVARISQNVLHRFSWKFGEGLSIDQGQIHAIAWIRVENLSGYRRVSCEREAYPDEFSSWLTFVRSRVNGDLGLGLWLGLGLYFNLGFLYETSAVITVLKDCTFPSWIFLCRCRNPGRQQKSGSDGERNGWRCSSFIRVVESKNGGDGKSAGSRWTGWKSLVDEGVLGLC